MHTEQRHTTHPANERREELNLSLCFSFSLSVYLLLPLPPLNISHCSQIILFSSTCTTTNPIKLGFMWKDVRQSHSAMFLKIIYCIKEKIAEIFTYLLHGNSKEEILFKQWLHVRDFRVASSLHQQLSILECTSGIIMTDMFYFNGHVFFFLFFLLIVNHRYQPLWFLSPISLFSAKLPADQCPPQIGSSTFRDHIFQLSAVDKPKPCRDR